MLPVWVVFMSERTGIYSRWEELQEIIEQFGSDAVIKFENEIVARKFIRENFSIERLFLMGIFDTNQVEKNKIYSLPEKCRGKFKETRRENDGK